LQLILSSQTSDEILLLLLIFMSVPLNSFHANSVKVTLVEARHLIISTKGVWPAAHKSQNLLKTQLPRGFHLIACN